MTPHGSDRLHLPSSSPEPSRDTAPGADGIKRVQLRLIETTDLHLHLMPYDYYADRALPGVGLVSAATLIEQARAEVANCLLFDNGDFLQGTPLGDHVALEHGLRGQVHPAIAAMNVLGYDALTLGNHEFNYGLDFLLETLAGAACPVVSANLVTGLGSTPRRDRPLVAPYTILERHLRDENGASHLLRLGVIGLAPPQVTAWDRHALQGRLWARDMLEAARAWVPEMREAGADLILALAHTGIDPSPYRPGMENAALPLARDAGFDALFAGHSHLLFPSPRYATLPEADLNRGHLAGTPTVMAGCWGAQIGVIDLELRRDGGQWQVEHARAGIRGASDMPGPAGPTAARVTACVAPAHAATLAAIRQPVGETAVALHSYFAHLGPTPALTLVAEAQRAHICPRLADPGIRALPVLSAASPFKAGGRAGPGGYSDVPAGLLALRHIADLYAFPNAMAALRVTGAEVLDWLERAATAFLTIAPGSREALLRDPAVPGYNFEQIDALDVTYDLSQPARFDAQGALINPAARRVASALFEGAALDPKQEFVLCTNSYRAGGAGQFPGVTPEKLLFSDGMITREALRAHVAQVGRLDPEPRGNLRFVPMPGTSVLYETGPGARAYLHEISRFSPRQRGTSAAGFLQLRLDLSQG